MALDTTVLDLCGPRGRDGLADFFNHYRLLEEALFFFNLPSLCGFSWTKQLKCLCREAAFLLKLTLFARRFR